MTMAKPWIPWLLCLAALGSVGGAFAAGAPAAKAPPEPADYRQADYRSPVPLTLKGAEVVSTAELVDRLADPRVVVVDVLHQQPRPPRLAPGNLWLPPPHQGIPGAVWLPNVGYGRLPEPVLAYFIEALRRITGGDPARPLVFYCRASCWMSWNAARRALSLGYRRVIWYPDGIDGWQAAGQPTALVKPFGNPPEPR